MPRLSSVIKLSCAVLLATMLGACGFQLRGVYNLPFSTMSISLADSTELYAQIRRNVETGSTTRVVATTAQADAAAGLAAGSARPAAVK